MPSFSCTLNSMLGILLLAGIAPYRSFLRRLFGEATPASKNFKGLAWLFLGVANKDALLYDEEFQVLFLCIHRFVRGVVCLYRAGSF